MNTHALVNILCQYPPTCVSLVYILCQYLPTCVSLVHILCQYLPPAEEEHCVQHVEDPGGWLVKGEDDGAPFGHGQLTEGRDQRLGGVSVET